MYVWYEIHAAEGFNQQMLNYRNSMVREINFVFSKSYSKIKDDPRIAKECEALKNRRIINSEKIGDPLQKSAVEASLLKDIFHKSLDFNSAVLYMKYFGLSNEGPGKDVYHDMRQPDSVYNKLIKDRLFSSALGFIQIFPRDDAIAEIEDIFRKAVDCKDDGSIMLIIEEMKKPQFIGMIKDPDIKQLLYDEAERAELEKRIEDARKIADLLGDTELNARLDIVDSLQNHEFKQAIESLKKLTDKERIRKTVIEYYNKELEKDDIGSLRRAFDLAYYGGFTADKDKKYLEKPAGKIIELDILKDKSGEKDYYEINKYMEFANKNHVLNIFSEKFLSLIESNETQTAKQLKDRFGLTFVPGRYNNEETVKKKFKMLTETAGIHSIPKGDENLRAALDIAKIFDFKEKEIIRINSLFCKHYISQRMFKEAKKYFVPNDKDTIELLENELLKLIDVKNYSNAYQLKNEFDLKYPKEILKEKKREIKYAISDRELSIDELAKKVIFDDIFELEVVSGEHYGRIIKYIEFDELNGVQTLIDLKVPIIRNADSYIKVMIYNVIKKLSEKSPNTAQKLAKTFEDILPPNFLDYIFYLIRKILGI